MKNRPVTKKKVCLSLDAPTLNRFQTVCDAGGLKYSQVVETLLLYFIDLETAAKTTELAAVDQNAHQEGA